MEKVVKHHVFGEILLEKKFRNRNIRIVVNPINGIRVSLPMFASFDDALRFVNSKSEELLKIIEKQKMLKRKRSFYGEGHDVKILSGMIIFKRELDSQLVKIKYKYNSIDLYFDNNEFFILYPKKWPKDIIPNSEEWKILNNALQKVVRKEAKRILPNRVLLLSSNMVKKVKLSGILKIDTDLLIKINNISIKNNRSNWGSCSVKKNINLNMNLLNLPIELIDYIIMHELCHLIYHNHSQNFHNLLNFFCEGREKEYIKEIKKYSLN